MTRTPLMHIFVFFAFILRTSVPAYAGGESAVLPKPGAMVGLSPRFNPLVLKGIKVDPENPFQFDFILDQGDSRLSGRALKESSDVLVKYFLTSLTVPDKEVWVNLSPYEKDRLIPRSFGLTEMGRDLLAQDYLLKQITASLVYPEDETGRRFWQRVYQESARQLGTTDAPVNTFNKVWIVPEKAVVYENAGAGTAYIVKSQLKVMLEEDYLAAQKNGLKSNESVNSKVLREIVIPELTREVNAGRNFAPLRQVYSGLILAAWYKKKIKDSVLTQVYAGRNKVGGVTTDDPQEKQKIYERYLQAFKKGVYNYIKEEQDPLTRQIIPRKYFSGGFSLQMDDKNLQIEEFSDSAMLAGGLGTIALRVLLNPLGRAAAFIPKRLPDVDAPSNRAVEVPDGLDPRMEILRRKLALRQEITDDERKSEISMLLERVVIDRGDRFWDHQGPVNAETVIRDILRYMKSHADVWDFPQMAKIFQRLVQQRAGFQAKRLPRLLVMHRLVWENFPELGVAMLDTNVEHLRQYANWISGKITWQRGFHHTADDLIYFYDQIEIAEKVLRDTQGKSLEQWLVSVIEGSDGALKRRADRLTLGLIVFHPEYAQKLKSAEDKVLVDSLRAILKSGGLNDPLSYDFLQNAVAAWSEGKEPPAEFAAFFQKIRDWVQSPGFRLWRLIHNELAPAVKDFDRENAKVLKDHWKYLERNTDPQARPHIGDVFESDGYMYLINDRSTSPRGMLTIWLSALSSPDMEEGVTSIPADRWFRVKPEVPEAGSIADRVVLQTDRSQISKDGAVNGGIDFNSGKLDLQLSSSSGGPIRFHMDPILRRQLQDASGFEPVIINIQTVTDLSLFLGIKKSAKP